MTALSARSPRRDLHRDGDIVDDIARGREDSSRERFIARISRAQRDRLLLLDADRFGCIEIVTRGEDGKKERERERARARETRGRKRETHHCCGRAATAGFATSRPTASTGADNRVPWTRT